MNPIVKYKDKEYLSIQASGNAARFMLPYFNEYCHGIGYDIGCNRLEWKMPGSIPIDPLIDPEYDAMHLPTDVWEQVDYIFSSHCLEHIKESWWKVLEYWTRQLKHNGVLFLYLPHYSQEYWRPWNNHKHFHILVPEHIEDCLKHLGYSKIFKSGVDLNMSYAIIAFK